MVICVSIHFLTALYTIGYMIYDKDTWDNAVKNTLK